MSITDIYRKDGGEEMLSIIAAVLLGIAAIVEGLLILGFPLGEFTMGGQYKVLPSKLRMMAGVSIVLQIFAGIIVLQAGGHIPLMFVPKATQVICYIFAGYFVLNTFMNLCSHSKKEKYIMTPVALVAAICFGITAFQMV